MSTLPLPVIAAWREIVVGRVIIGVSESLQIVPQSASKPDKERGAPDVAEGDDNDALASRKSKALQAVLGFVVHVGINQAERNGS